MVIDNLKEMYVHMKSNKLERSIFEFTFNNVAFEVLYFIDDSPHILGFGILSHNFYFEVEVQKGFNLKPIMSSEDYNNLKKILNLKYDPSNPFRPIHFFTEFNHQLKKINQKYRVPKPHQVAQFRNDVEEAEKIYFKGWRDNNVYKTNVSPENLEKTRKLLSKEAFEMCKRKNISSKWTANPSLAKDYSAPS